MNVTLEDLPQFLRYCQIHCSLSKIIRQNDQIYCDSEVNIIEESSKLIRDSLNKDSFLKEFCLVHKMKIIDLDLLYLSLFEKTKTITLEKYMQESIFAPYESEFIPKLINKVKNSRIIKKKMLVFDNPYFENSDKKSTKNNSYDLISLMNSKEASKKSQKRFLIEFDTFKYLEMDKLVKELFFLDKILNINVEHTNELDKNNQKLLYSSYLKKIERSYKNTLDKKDSKFSRFLSDNSLKLNDLVFLNKIVQQHGFDQSRYTISENLYSQFKDEQALSKLINQKLIKKELFWYELTEKTINGLFYSDNCVLNNTNLVLSESPNLNFDDLCVSKRIKNEIINVISQHKNNDLIFNKWGIGKKITYGKGITINFFGPPGTGKTMSAKVIANYLHKKLLTVNYPEVESMWVGETEKNIRELFNTAKTEDAIIFFDEADTLTTKRENARLPWEISRTNTLLKELENFEGICIFATNNWCSYDEAFDRRLSAHIEFKLPTQKESVQIFNMMLPNKKILSKDVDFSEIAMKYEGILSGGDVKNIVLNSARIAANDSSNKTQKIFQRHILDGSNMVLASKRKNNGGFEGDLNYIG
ncbi:MAG TPA: ATP-binding protein [Candidatus Woesearchaeota archaeon]|nr:ATP-binding protein [Candidatus Woesearchaeota archaeon]